MEMFASGKYRETGDGSRRHRTVPCLRPPLPPLGYFQIILTAQNTRDKAITTFTGI